MAHGLTILITRSNASIHTMSMAVKRVLPRVIAQYRRGARLRKRTPKPMTMANQKRPVLKCSMFCVNVPAIKQISV
jgi:hypothetical protein